MDTLKYIYYQEDKLWVGWFEEFPDYKSQGETLDELKENLKDIYQTLNSGEIPNVRRYGELVVG
jgi:predicted RNase H-like HicB family nuclease